MIDDLDVEPSHENEIEANETSDGLGLGLNALFDEDDSDVEAVSQYDAVIEAADAVPAFVDDSKIVDDVDEDVKSDNVEILPGGRHTVGVAQLYPGPFQPRKTFEEEAINELADSIRQYGVLQPLLVRPAPDNPGHYEIIAGERRWRASQLAQLHEVPVVFLDIDDVEASKIALIENLQREDLDAIEEAQGYQRLINEYGLTQEQLASDVGRSRPHITNMIRLLGLPEGVQQYLAAGDLSVGHARALISAEDPERLAKDVIKKGLSVRQTEKLAAQVKGKKTAVKKANDNMSEAATKDSDTLALEHDISNALGMSVSIDSADGRTGMLSVEFKSLDQLDDLLHRLAHHPSSRLNG